MTKRPITLSLSSSPLGSSLHDEELPQKAIISLSNSPDSNTDLRNHGDDGRGRGRPGSRQNNDVVVNHQSPSPVSSEADASTISSNSFRKRGSFSSLDHYFRSTAASAATSLVSPSVNSQKSKLTTITTYSWSNHLRKQSSMDPPSYLSKRWARRRHPVIATTATFFVLWACWTVVITLLQFQTAVDPLSIMMEADVASNSASSDAMASTSRFLNQQHQSLQHSSTSTSSLLSPPSRSLAAPLIRGVNSHSIPLPLPKQKISVVLMNFSRPRMIRESTMMRTLLSHPNIDEVLLLHANPKTAFEFVHPKVVNIDAVDTNNELGLSLRFFYCQTAKNEWILHLDDDMEFTTEALNELIIEFERNPKRIVGRFGRDMTPGNSFNGYNSQNRHKSAEVVLTKLMLVEREMCSAFFEYAHLVWNDVILHNGEGPLWNGEDIFMSLVANHVYGPPKDGSSPYNNYAMDWLDVWQADDSLKDYDNGKYDISGGMKGIQLWNWRWWQTVLKRNRHYSYRGHLWKIARERLKELG
ncbi:glycosyl transferase family 64 protein [Nitzschia inconspicua]|uniref:Glycosyl transferase family 64 protein n=1 Tax=Nitzschia inconspicua TaxID=303405 RepID=A0A9K3L7T0_9STRA|nr:glycosyl transferase family 64 protein [Nitzschia inconspicua]